MAVETYDRNFIELMLSQLHDRESLLDIGSGLCSLLRYMPYKHIIALDIHRPYLVNRICMEPHIIPLLAEAKSIGKLFIPDSVSTVSFMDSLEHFTKIEALELLQDAEQIAKHQVVVFAPRGYFPQKGIDHYGMNGESYQEHRSSWEPEELEARGYAVTVLKGFHDHNNSAFTEAFGYGHDPVDALLAIKTKR
ncbi:hypothetical protein ACFO9Q_18365 [Paenibacillus sp. GCM10023252]|uniref:hypothetical protein n=1 Tax=Paenibacillus sp. GCM10023252 TaxID=3252649 RepID=UPI003615E1BB